MTIIIDNYFGTSGVTYSYLSAAQKADMDNALAFLLADASTGAMLNALAGLYGPSYNIIFTTYSTAVAPAPSGSAVYFPGVDAASQATWRTALEAHFANDYDHGNPSVSQITFDKTKDIVIYFNPNNIEQSIAGTNTQYDDNGSGFNYELSRMMFHELAHVRTLPDAWNTSFNKNWTITEPREADTVALNAEDIIWRANQTTKPVIGGHGPIVTLNFAGVTAFDLLTGTASVSLGQIDGLDAAIFAESQGGRTVRKFVFVREVASPGAFAQDLNHYIVNEAVEAHNVHPISATGTISPLLAALMVDSPQSATGSTVAAKAQAVAHTLDYLTEFQGLLETFHHRPNSLATVLANLPSLDQTTSRMVSAESSSMEGSPVIVEVGPIVAGGSMTPATYLPVVASPGVGTVLIGGSGIDDRNAHFAARLDDLKGNSAADLLIGGDGTGPDNVLRSILDGGGSGDILVTGSGRSDARGGRGIDLFLAGSGETMIDGGGERDIFKFLGSGAARIDLTDVVDGYAHATQGGADVRFKGVEIFVGGAGLTTFVGKGAGLLGSGSVFIAGLGGGDFTLKAGDYAFGRAGVKDTFRVSTTVPDEFSSYTEAQKVEYLEHNRVYIGRLDPNDEVVVGTTTFTGNHVTSSIAPTHAVLPNHDLEVTSIWYTGDSSYNTLYPQAEFQEFGPNDARYVYDGTQSIRDVSYVVADGSGIGLITFSARTAHANPLDPNFLEYDPLSSSDEMLTLVIDGFSDGDGGMSFSHDALFQPPGSLAGANIFVDPLDVTDPMRIPIDFALDLIDGNQDGYAEGGGTSVDSDSSLFNFGMLPFEGREINWETFVAGADKIDGSAGTDALTGRWGDDILSGLEGDDTLTGGAGDDILDGGAGADTMIGGEGNDTYFVDDEDDIVVEAADEGNDTVVVSILDYTLGANVENLIHSGSGNFTGSGNALANVMTGGEGDDNLFGDDGDDTFVFSGGEDSIDGGAGIDTLRIDGDANAFTLSQDISGVITISNPYDGGFVPFEVVSIEKFFFSSQGESFTFEELADHSLTGTSADENLSGNSLNNAIAGLDGDDVIQGGAGNDELDGGNGFDIAYYIGSSADFAAFWDPDGILNIEDLIGGEGSDTLQSIEQIYFAGDGVTLDPGDLPPVGTIGDDTITGTNGVDILFGLEGNDILSGLDGDDYVEGGDGNDRYIFGLGNDRSYDPTGDDTYVYVAGEGDDALSDNDGFDVIELGGVDPADVVVTNNSGDYVLTFSTASGSLTIYSGAVEGSAVEEVHFDDETVWTDDDLATLSGGGFDRMSLGYFHTYSTNAHLTAGAWTDLP